MREWASCSIASVKIGVDKRRLHKSLDKKRICGGYFWSREKKEFLDVFKKPQKGRDVINLLTGEVFPSIAELARSLNKNTQDIWGHINHCKNKKYDYYDN